MGEEWERLGRLVRERRTQLGHTSVGAFADAAGLSRRVISDFEGAKRTNFDQVTIRQVEYALGWNDGSIASVLAGGEPVTVDDPEAHGMPGPARLADAVRQRRNDLGISRDELVTRSGLSGRMVDAIESGRVILKPGPRAQLADALGWADGEVAEILRAQAFGVRARLEQAYPASAEVGRFRGSYARSTGVTPIRDFDVAAELVTAAGGPEPSFTLEPGTAAEVEITDQARRLSWLTGPDSILGDEGAARLAAAVEAVMALTLPPAVPDRPKRAERVAREQRA